MILDTILENRAHQVAASQKKCPVKILAARAGAHARSHPTADFAGALRGGGLSVIAEIKRASPSKGLIRQDFDPVAIAREYEAAGAACLSVLTEETYFRGSGDYLKAVRQAVNLPLLRKDFIINAWQVYESCLLGADAILLIASVLDAKTLARLIETAGALDMQCLVEAHTPDQLQKALGAGARMVGVNNRDLRDFSVDFTRAERLRTMVPRDVVFVAESGVSGAADMRRLHAVGANAVLMGEILMRAPSPGARLKELREAADED